MNAIGSLLVELAAQDVGLEVAPATRGANLDAISTALKVIVNEGILGIDARSPSIVKDMWSSGI